MTDLTGQAITLCGGTTVTVIKKIGLPGAQGQCYLARNRKTGSLGVIKQFDPARDLRASGRRIRFLCDVRLGELSPLFTSAPVLWFGNDRDGWGHWAVVAPGSTLNELIATGTWGPPFPSLVQLALAVATALRDLHKVGTCHGDTHGDNLFVEEDGNVLRATFIDFDNFWHARMPDPQTCLGQIMYMAPEVRYGADRGVAHPVDELAERYSLGALMHLILLLRHHNHGKAENPAEFHRAMLAGEWECDPLVAPGAIVPGGYPVKVLSPTLTTLLRRSLGVNRHDRPSAADWVIALDRTLHDEIYPCPACGGFCVADPTKVRCPLCDAPFPGMELHVIGTGRTIPVELGGIRLTRTTLGGDGRISGLHATIERVGPAFRICSFGTNGTFRQTPNGLIRLPDNASVTVAPGDVLAFANAVVVELRSIPVAA